MLRIGIIGTENSHATAFAKAFNLPDEKGNYPYGEVRVTVVMGEDAAANNAVAQAAGVGILLENHSKPGAWQYPDYNFHMERFLMLWEKLKDLPIHINFDTANSFALGDWKRILDAVAGRIATVHLNDLASVEPLAFTLVGDGIVPMEQMLDAVYATGFAGDLCIEEAAFRGFEGIELAAAYTKNLAKKYGF